MRGPKVLVTDTNDDAWWYSNYLKTVNPDGVESPTTYLQRSIAEPLIFDGYIDEDLIVGNTNS